jgi:CubicO group peptidase (beta-lactamase class C family)
VSAGSRSLPSRPSLRYLRLEAKRRLAAGEFTSLHEAQAAIAREHGRSSWAGLKQDCAAESHALAQVRWLIARFRTADRPGWIAPAAEELRGHVDHRFLAAVPDLVTQLSRAAADLRSELVVISQRPLEASVTLAGMRYFAAVDDQPPHRLIALQGFPLAARITDPRVLGPPPAQTLGPVPAHVPAVADRAFAELGLAALVLAGGNPGHPPWTLAKGHADLGGADLGGADLGGADLGGADLGGADLGGANLDRAEPLHPGHRFPVPGVTALVTATAVLRLVAEGRIGLDEPAPLRSMRLADGAVTVRELLSHTGGVSNPAEPYAVSVPDLATLMGPVVPCGGRRGVPRPSNGGYAVLGQLIADVTQLPYARAVTQLVLDPLGMRDSRFPDRATDIGPGAVTGYTVNADGAFVPFPALVSTVQAVAGLWSTGPDLVRLGAGWSSLLPAELAAQALTVQARGEYRVGLGWLISPGGDTAVHSGVGLEATASLRVRVRDLRTHVVLTNRQIPLDSIDLGETDV